MKKISLVIPMYNEEPMVALLFATLKDTLLTPLKDKYAFEIIAVNDGSKDKTLELLKEEQKECPELVIVNLSRNWGQEPAVRAGLLTAERHQKTIGLTSVRYPVRGSQIQDLIGYIVGECLIMLDEDHRYVTIADKPLDLLSDIDIYVVQRFIPDIDISLLTKRQSDHHDLLLP